MTMSLKIVQHNLNKQRIASLQLRDLCDNTNADIVLLQEPVVSQNGKIYGFENCKQVSGGANAGAAVIIMNTELRAIELADLTTQHVVAVKVHRRETARTVTVVSTYFKYDMPTPYFITKLRSILDREPCTVIGADVNGHSELWHCPTRNSRGIYTEELIEDYDLTVANKPSNLCTYDRDGMGSSNIDVTLLTPSISSQLSDWTVHDVTDSDHNVLTYTLGVGERAGQGPRIQCRFNTDRADWEKFAQSLSIAKLAIDFSTLESQACTIVGAIREAAIKSIPQKRYGNSKSGKQPWWNDELASLRNELSRKRRMGLNRVDKPAYNRMRNQYLNKIRRAKAESWRKFASDINSNAWGKTFAWAKRGAKTRAVPSTMKRAYGTFTQTLSETADLLLDAFFPSDNQDRDEELEESLMAYDKPTNTDRVKAAIWRMNPRKAPGKDGITAGILKKAWPILANEITSLFKTCLENAIFPSTWKEANLVVLPKPGKTDMTSPKSYRPVSLLPTIAKALETLIIQDLEAETDLNSYDPQHGFVPGRSTITAMKAVYDWTNASKSRHVIGVFLDITGAFDNVRWHPLLARLKALGASARTIKIMQSYLRGRTVSYILEGHSYNKELERGCPQGSQIGPTLWKVAMTGIGELPADPAVTTVQYADDIALLVGAARPQTAIARIEAHLNKMKTWADEYGLCFSPAKSQMLSLKGGLKPGYTASFGTNQDAPEVIASGTVKYLGVILDSRHSYWHHIRSIKDKSADLYKRLRTMTSANWGMNQLTAKVIYEAVFLPRVTYAAEVWSEGCSLKKSIKALCSMQRAPLLAITSAYRTASTNCLSAVAGVLPLDLEIRRLVMRRRLRKGETTYQEYENALARLIEEWQVRYDATDKGEWTKFMIPDLARRYEIPLRLDYYTTQFLTGHGDFKSKLHSFKLQPSPNCSCGSGAETARHVLLACKRTKVHRDRLKAVMINEGEAWPPVNGAFLRTRRTYEALRKFSKDSLQNRTDR